MKGKKNIKHYRPDKDYTIIACNNQPNRKMRNTFKNYLKNVPFFSCSKAFKYR